MLSTLRDGALMSFIVFIGDNNKLQDMLAPLLTPRYYCCKNFTTYGFRFKRVGFDHATDDKAIFDEFYLIDYVFGSFSTSGQDVMNEAHLLSHFNHVQIAKPIAPHHADESVRDLMLSASYVLPNANLRRKKHAASSHKQEPVVASRPAYFQKSVEL